MIATWNFLCPSVRVWTKHHPWCYHVEMFVSSMMSYVNLQWPNCVQWSGVGAIANNSENLGDKIHISDKPDLRSEKSETREIKDHRSLRPERSDIWEIGDLRDKIWYRVLISDIFYVLYSKFSAPLSRPSFNLFDNLLEKAFCTKIASIVWR